MISSGSRELDEFLNPRHPGFHRDDLVLVTGPPKSGKSLFLQMIAERALASGQLVAVFDWEGSLRRRWREGHHRLSWFDTTRGLPHSPEPYDLTVFDGLDDSLLETLRSNHPIKLISSTSSRNGDTPRRLSHMADYVLRTELSRDRSRLVVNVGKNRNGPQGREFVLGMPPIPPAFSPPRGKTIWERLLLPGS